MSPFKPLHPCNKPGCKELTSSRFCLQHEQEEEARYEKERGSASERGYDARWHKASKKYLDEHPLCFECERQGIERGAVLTHHIVPVSKGGAMWDEDNFMALCFDCHEEKHRRDRWRR